MGWSAFTWDRPADVAVGGLIVLTLGAVAVRLSRQPVRRIRLVLWSLVGAAALPILAASPITPRWSIPVLPGEAEPRPIAVEPPRPATPLHPPAIATADGPTAPPSVESRKVDPPPAPSPIVPAARREPWTPAALLAGAYAAGAAGMVAWWLLGQAAFARLVRSSRPASGAAREALREIAGPGADRVRLLEGERVASPCTNTWIRPVILLPSSLAAGDDTEALRYALAHEWSHVERRDAWAWNLAALLGLALFHQPLFWWLRRRLRLAQDELADARAAAAGSAEGYAAFLVRIARSRDAGPPWPALGIGERRSELYRRVLMVVQPREPLEARCRPAWSLAVAAIAAVIALAASGVHLDAMAQESENPPDVASKAEGEALHHNGVVKDKDTGAPIAGAEVTVRRSLLTARGNRVVEETHHKTAADGTYEFTIPPDQASERYMYIELDVAHPDYAPRSGFGYSLSMIRKNIGLGERPFFESVELRPARPITGKVETPEGEPAAGVDLLAYSTTDKAFEYGSFARATTDADGSFRIPITTPGKGVLWILPKDFAPESRELLDGRRGDLGTFRLKPGVRLTGTALDIDGKPVAGMLVQARREDAPVAGLPVSDAVERTTETDAQGRFAFDPLPAGAYHVAPTDFDSRAKRSEGWEPREVPGVFLPIKVTIADGQPPAPLEMRESPHVVLEGGWVDSQGRPSRGWACIVSGTYVGEQSWFDEARPGDDGRFSLKVPRGLVGTTVQIMTNEHASARYRVGKDAPLTEGRSVVLGTLDHDVKDLEIVRYVAPLILIDARTKDGEQIEGFKAEAEYTGDHPDGEKRVDLSGGRRETEAIQDEQNDGRYRTSQLLPDREVKVSVSAKGFKPAERTMKLAEGTTEEATFVLEPR
ncbi:M56 family metallopeptidase [Paludisphaera sp.]|uniref:M56 family metallopeptidase n=1 Tax=Paludisphaera sp. TaxID=2017432 RepID=UPI00301E5A52